MNSYTIKKVTEKFETQMAQDSPDKQERPLGKWKNWPLTSDQDVELFHQLFSDGGDE
jgi:hypothetical protein